MKRRSFLATGGSLVVGFTWTAACAQGLAPAAPAPPVPPGGAVNPLLANGWIRIDADGRITVFTGKAELGQGIRTALLQVAAEELMVEPGRITLVSADTARTPNEGYTAGSNSMKDSGTAIRRAASQVRVLLLARAARRLALPAGQLVFDNGNIRGGGQTLGYGALAAETSAQAEAAPPPATPLDPARYRVLGNSLPRTDIPAKLTGGVAYVQDLRFEGMVHGRIVRPPGPGALLRRIDTAPVMALPGVLGVVRDGRFLGVLAQREFQCIVAARVLAEQAQWDAGLAALPSPASWGAELRAARTQDEVILERGDVSAAGGRMLEADYERPYQMHASIGPSCALALLRDGAYTVWTHSQGVFPLRRALAELLGVAQEKVHCIHVEGSGCYGHNGADDVAADAVLLARALPGRPVRVQWMRGDEHAWEPLGPPMATRVRARVDAAGAIQAWQYEVWSNAHSTRPGTAGNLLAGTLLERPFAPPAPRPIPQPEGGGDRNAIPLYVFPHIRVTHHFLPDMPLRVSALRALGAYMNVFSIECSMDDLARAANTDPVAFRLRHLDDPRARAVVQRAAERFGWNTFRSSGSRGRGFGFARYKNQAAYAAVACEVEVWRDSGELRILRMVAAVDCGEAVNPDGIRNQIEGGIVQAASWTLLEEVRVDGTQVTSVDWAGYPILRFPAVPGSVDVHVIDQPGSPFLGTGEAAQGPAAAAIANAAADATGVRMRSIPFTRAKVRSALGER